VYSRGNCWTLPNLIIFFTVAKLFFFLFNSFSNAILRNINFNWIQSCWNFRNILVLGSRRSWLWKQFMKSNPFVYISIRLIRFLEFLFWLLLLNILTFFLIYSWRIPILRTFTIRTCLSKIILSFIILFVSIFNTKVPEIFHSLSFFDFAQCKLKISFCFFQPEKMILLFNFQLLNMNLSTLYSFGSFSQHNRIEIIDILNDRDFNKLNSHNSFCFFSFLSTRRFQCKAKLNELILFVSFSPPPETPITD